MKNLLSFRSKVFLKSGLFLVAFLGLSAATYAGDLTITNTNPDPTVGTNVPDFTVTIDIAATADVADGENIAITLPANFPEVATSDADDGKVGLSAITLGGVDVSAYANITITADTRTLTVTFDDVDSLDGGAEAIVNGDDLVLTFSTDADAAGTASIAYVGNWTIDGVSLTRTIDGAFVFDGVTVITTNVGALSATNIEPASLRAGAESTNTVSFTTTAAIPSGGKIVLTYPDGWDVADANGLTAANLSGVDGTWTASVSGQVITLTQSGGTATSAGAISFTLDGIATKGTTGSGGTYTITTTTATPANIQTDTAVTADTLIGGGSNSSVNLANISNIQLQSVEGGIQITWDEPTTPAAVTLQILRGKNDLPVNGVPYAQIGTSESTYTDSDVVEGDVVRYVFRTTDGSQNYSSDSEELTFTVGSDAVVSSDDEESSEEEVVEEEEATEEEEVTEEESEEETEVEMPELTDISGHWGAEVIGKMVAKGVAKGNPDGTFNPDGNLNRAEAAALLYRVLGMEEPSAPAEMPFSDVEVSAWYAPYVGSLKDMSLANGNPDGTYAPAKNINRAEFLTLALNVYQHLNGEVEATTSGTFSDVEAGAWYEANVEIAAEMGVVSGYECDGGKCFRPESEITRAEATKILYNMFFAMDDEEEMTEESSETETEVEVETETETETEVEVEA